MGLEEGKSGEKHEGQMKKGVLKCVSAGKNSSHLRIAVALGLDKCSLSGVVGTKV